MAVYKGREVSLMHDIPKGFHDPIDMTIRFKDGSTETVRLSELSFTADEKRDLEKAASERYDNLKVIEDKDLQELRDSQDEDKIKKLQEKQDTPRDVTITAQGAKVEDAAPQARTPVVHNARPVK